MARVAEVQQFPPMVREQNAEAVGQAAPGPLPITHLIGAEYVSAVPRPSPSLPDHMLLGSLLDGRLRVVAPIVVKCGKENDDIVVEAVELDEFGFGKNLSEAIRDLQAAIVELYFALEQESNRLGSDLQRVWKALQRTIRRRP